MFVEISFLKKIFHFLPIVLVYFVIIMVTYGFTTFYIFDENGLHFVKILSGITFYFCSAMVLICHLKSMLTSPGFVNEGWEINYKSIYCPETTIEKNPVNSVLTPYDKKLFCQKCNNSTSL